MTTRRLNYTGCKRIRRADVDVTVDDKSMPLGFRFARKLDEYDFPSHARVVIEAQAHWTLMRFDCGTVSVPAPDQLLPLADFDSSEGISFRLKVLGTGETAGLILGEADGIRPGSSVGFEEARSLLAVQPAELGHVAWRMSFAGAEPLLQINNKILDWRSFMRRPEVRALLMPELYRQMLREASRNPADGEAADAWQSAILSMVLPAAGPCPSGTDDDALEMWIDDAVGQFAARHKLLRGVGDWEAKDV